MLHKSLTVTLVLCLPLSTSWGDGFSFARNVQTYIYQPWVFADRKLTVGLPTDTRALGAMLWYVRMDESTRSLAGMERLSQYVRSARIPGLDFSGHRTLTNNDLAMLFRSDRWKRNADPAWKFRLLKLSGTLTDDRSLPTVGQLSDLKVLNLSDRVSDTGVVFLKSLTRLHSLGIPSAQITDQSLKTLARLSNLQRLSLPSSRITDAGLTLIKALPLRQLDLGPLITDTGVPTLSSISSLEELNLQTASVTAQGLRALVVLPRLHTLFLGRSWRDADMSVLGGLKHLRRLDLSKATLSDASASLWKELPLLEELALSDTPVGEVTFQVLSTLPHLRYLEISGTRITSSAWRNVKGFSSLQVISFSSATRLKAKDLWPLAKLPQLHTILVNGVPIRRVLVERLRAEASSSAWGNILIPTAYAGRAADEDIEAVLEVASRPEGKSRRLSSFTGGLPLIHETEASLDEIIAAPTMMGLDNQQDTEQNFLGELVIDSRGTVIKKENRKDIP